MIVLSLSLRDLLRDRFFFFCNVAVMAGILAPLLVLFGVKNGVYQALIGEMMSNPATLQIDTLGNNDFDAAQIDALRRWPEVAFVTPRVRSQFDFVNVYAPAQRKMRDALIVPSGSGDPTLPDGLTLEGNRIALSPQLADQLQARPGDRVELVTQGENRTHQLALKVEVVAILSPAVVSGNTVLAPYPLLDLIEAFYDAYALPEYGIVDGRPLSERVASYEGIRLYSRSLEGLSALQTRTEEFLGTGTRARSREVEALLGLGRNLDLALGLVTSLASAGLFAALVFSFWTEVLRKRNTLASITLLGVPPHQLAWFPLVQGLVTTACGLALSFALYAVAALAAERLFAGGLPPGRRIAVIDPLEAAAICAATVVVVIASLLLAARSAQRLDPASVLREGA